MNGRCLILLSCLFFAFCNNPKEQTKQTENFRIDDNTIQKVIGILSQKSESTDKSVIEKGVRQVAALWTVNDGTITEFETFCSENFIAQANMREQAFEKISRNFEILYGNFIKMSYDLRLPVDVNKGEITTIDELFASYDVSAHIIEDLFNNKTAFVIALNFPNYSLTEKTASKSWNRKDWAYARLGDIFTSRVPSDLILKISEATAKSDAYISEYNIFMGNLINDKNETFFPKDKKLITHWGLRDDLKSNYADPNGLTKQKIIYAVMKNIITQQIPENVINNDKYQWEPIANKLFLDGKEVSFNPEPNTRYLMLLNNFKAIKAIDAYNPQMPTFLNRKFDGELEIALDDVEKLFISVLTSNQVKEVGELIKKRLGRNLEPFDIWYDGFKSRSTISEDELDKITMAKYPDVESFQKDLPNILHKLQFSSEKAKYICEKITVDPSRGAGHAAGAGMRGDKARLRTRVGEKGMNYKGYNIAIHEFGHNVEQTISLYDVDYYIMNGVPNTAFTEALAFLFQKRDLELIGINNNNPDKEFLETLDIFWSCYEIMGVSLVDIGVWKWLYANPNASPEDLKNAVISIAKDVWNKYYAPVYGLTDEPILAIYSHMIDAPLYLSAYPIGELIQFQIEGFIKGKHFANEVLRIYTLGRMIPQVWMKQAVGSELSSKPILDATSEALQGLKKM